MIGTPSTWAHASLERSPMRTAAAATSTCHPRLPFWPVKPHRYEERLLRRTPLPACGDRLDKSHLPQLWEHLTAWIWASFGFWGARQLRYVRPPRPRPLWSERVVVISLATVDGGSYASSSVAPRHDLSLQQVVEVALPSLFLNPKDRGTSSPVAHFTNDCADRDNGSAARAARSTISRPISSVMSRA
jgi:hypothetical protein